MHQRAEIAWRDGGQPVSTLFDDPYFSLVDGLAEARHVFLAGNDLPSRFQAGFHIAELGFGSGLNLLAALAAFRANNTPGRLHFTSFEAFPMTPVDMVQTWAAFPEIADLGQDVLGAWSPDHPRIETDDLVLQVIIGDARATVPRWTGQADAWFLDGFSPAKNPELWGDQLLGQVGHHTAPGGSFATYTAAGHVRRALSDAGFAVTRIPGFGRKRHMSVGQKP